MTEPWGAIQVDHRKLFATDADYRKWLIDQLEEQAHHAYYRANQHRDLGQPRNAVIMDRMGYALEEAMHYLKSLDSFEAWDID